MAFQAATQQNRAMQSPATPQDTPLLLTGHTKDLGGGFTVSRLLPSAKRQAVGPFLFFDHFGPVQVVPESRHDVGPHPHIGLATVTYLFEGAMMHRDSIGSVQRIEPGAINWMSAGRGIVHSERRPEDLAQATYVNHGLQLWAALPAAHEEGEPAFSHTAAAELPEHTLPGGHTLRVLIGKALGFESPVQTLSETLYLDLQLAPGESFTLPALAEEMAVYPVSEPLLLDGQAVQPRTLAVLPTGQSVTLAGTTGQAQRVMVIGGAPLDGHRLIWWNFVSTQRERIIQAGEVWAAGGIGHVPGDDEGRLALPTNRPLPA